jgi:hypothetical protein
MKLDPLPSIETNLIKVKRQLSEHGEHAVQKRPSAGGQKGCLPGIIIGQGEMSRRVLYQM